MIIIVLGALLSAAVAALAWLMDEFVLNGLGVVIVAVLTGAALTYLFHRTRQAAVQHNVEVVLTPELLAAAMREHLSIEDLGAIVDAILADVNNIVGLRDRIVAGLDHVAATAATPPAAPMPPAPPAPPARPVPATGRRTR
ncbi:MAG TPA: hypothetical protein VLG67_01360 [Candidatus Saccharimonadales bacterium]|nr:hypothetical protein [Candidatus Saccharimonadales bacterium]